MRNRAARALIFPFEDRQWFPKIAIGGAFGLALQVLFVGASYLLTRELAVELSPLAQAANFPSLGFVLLVFQGALMAPQSDSMPEWGRWPSLCVQGLILFVIGLSYGVIPLLLIVLGFGLLVNGGVALVLGLVMMLLGMLAGLTFGFFLPMAAARYLTEGRLEAAFNPVAVWSRITKVLPEYVAAYLLSIGSFIVAGLVGAVPYVGVLAWPFLTFYLMVASVRLFGEVCSGAA